MKAASNGAVEDGTSIKGNYKLEDGKEVDASDKNTPVSDEFYYIVPDKCHRVQGLPRRATMRCRLSSRLLCGLTRSGKKRRMCCWRERIGFTCSPSQSLTSLNLSHLSISPNRKGFSFHSFRFFVTHLLWRMGFLLGVHCLKKTRVTT